MSSICGTLNKVKGDLKEVQKYSKKMSSSKKIIEKVDTEEYNKLIDVYNNIYTKIDTLERSKQKLEYQNKELNKGLDTKQPFNILNTILTVFKSLGLYNPLSSLFSENFLTNIISKKTIGKDSILKSIVDQIEEIYSKTYKTSVDKLREFDVYKDMVNAVTQVLEGKVNKWLFNTDSLTDPFKDVIEINKIINADNNIKINKVISSKLEHNIIHYKIEVTYQGPDANGKFIPKTKVVNIRMSTIGSNGNEKLTYKILDSIKDNEVIPLNSNSYINNAIISFFAIPVNEEKTKYILPPEMLKAMSLATAATLNEVANADKMLREKILKILFNDDDENRIMNMYNYTPKDINDAINLVRNNGIPRQELITYLGSFILNSINAKVDNSINATDGSLIKETIGAYALSLIVNNSNGKIVENIVPIPLVEKNYLLYKLNPENKLPEDSIKTLSTYSSLIQRLTGLSIGQPEIIPEGVETGYANNKVKGQEEYIASNEIMSFMNKEEEEVYNSNIAFKPFVNLPEDIALITMGGREESDILNNDHVDNYEVELSKNDDYMRRREVILERQDLVKSGFKTKWRIVKNLRTMMDSIVNPQDNKVHRFLLKLKYAVNGEEYNGMEAKNDEDFKDFYYLALSQAFDMDPDKLTDKTVINNVKQKVILEKIRNRDYVRAVIKDAELKEIVNGFIKNNVEMSKEDFTKWLSTPEGQKAKEQYINFIKNTEHMHAYLALIDLYHFTQTNAKTGPYHTQLTVESDAITSGMVLTILQSLGSNPFSTDMNSLLDKISYYLFKAGVYTQRGIDVIKNNKENIIAWDVKNTVNKLNMSDKEFKKDIKEIQKAFDNGTLTHGMLKEKYPWFNDFYETLAIGVTNFLNDPRNYKVEDSHINETEEAKDKESLKKAKAYRKYNYLVDTMLNVFPKEFKRSLVKPAQMVFTYGASIKNIINKMYYSIMYSDIKDTFNELGRKYNITTYQLLLMMYSIAADTNTELKDKSYKSKEWYKQARKLFSSLDDKHKNTIRFLTHSMTTYNKSLDYSRLVYNEDFLSKDGSFGAFADEFFKNFSIVEYNPENRRTTTTQIKKYVQERENKDNPMHVVLGNVKLNQLIIPFSTKNKLNNTLYKLFDKVYGEAFRSVFDHYEFITNYRNEVKNQSKITYGLTKILLNKELKLYLKEHGLTDKNQLTKEQHKEIITNMIEKNNWYNYKSIQSLSTQDTYVPLDKTEKVSESRAYTFTSKKVNKNTNITPNTNEYIDNSIAAPVVTIHQIDSKMIVETLLKSFFNDSYYVHTGHIFDALLMQLNAAQILNTNYTYNKSTIHTNASYNVVLTAFNKNIHLIDQVKKATNNNISEIIDILVRQNNPEFDMKELRNGYNNLNKKLKILLDGLGFSGLIDGKPIPYKDLSERLLYYNAENYKYTIKGIIEPKKNSKNEEDDVIKANDKEKEVLKDFLTLMDTLQLFTNLNYDNPEESLNSIKEIYKEFYDQKMVVGHNYISDNPNTLYINNDETKPINLLDKNLDNDKLKPIQKQLIEVEPSEPEQKNKYEQPVEIGSKKLENYNEEDIPFSSSTKYMGTKTGEDTINSAEEAENFLINNLLGSLTVSKNIVDNFIKSTKLAFKTLDKVNLLHYINTTFNRGAANLTTKTIKLSSTINPSIQSEAEIYMHEMLHMYSQLALNYDQDLRVVVKRLQKATLKHMKANGIDPETFFIQKGTTITSATKNQSRDLFYYALEGSPEEFLVIANTNNILNKYIKSNNIKVSDKLINNIENDNIVNNLLNKVIDIVNNLYNVFFVKTTPVDKQLEEVLNNSILMTNELRKGNSPKKSKLDIRYESLTEFAINKLFSKDVKEKYREAFDNFVKAVVDGSKQLSKEYNRNYSGSEIQQGVKKISQKLNFDFEHFTRNLLKEAFIPNITFKDFYLLFNKIMYNREVARKHVESDIISTINDLIGKDKDIGFKSAMTNILIKSDLIHLPFNHSYISRLLNDRDFIKSEYTNIDTHLKDIIKDDRTYKAIMNQAKALGYYMVKGKATVPNLQFNADNIANMLFDQTHSIPKLDPSIKEEVVTNLDKYITLYSLSYSADNEIVGEWFSKNEKNSKELFMLLKNNLKSYKDELFEDSSSGSYKVKGFIRPKRTTKYEFKYIPINKLDFYKSQGYSEVRNPTTNEPVTRDTYVGKTILVKRLDISSNYTKGILEVTDNDILGTTLSEIMFNKDDISTRNIINLMVQDQINTKPILSSSFDPSDSDKEYMIPLYAMDAYDFSGGTSPKIVDYRFGIPDSSFLGITHDMSIDTAVANTISHDRLKINGRKFNAVVLDKMLEEYHKSKDKSEWIPLCSPAAASKLPKEIRDKYKEEYWAILPKYTKNYIGNRVFYINRWLQDDVFGYKDVNPENLGKTSKEPEVRKLSYIVGLSTKLWKDLIKLLKFPLVFNNSAVLIGNFSSNMMILLSYRPKPQLIKDFITKWKQLDAYQKTQEDINKLDLKIKSGIATSTDKTRIKVLRDKLSRNSMHEIVANGIIGSIIDDVTVDNITDFDNNLISSYIKGKNPVKDKKINSLINTIFLTEDSAISKQMLKIMQYTDGISKAIMYEEFQKQDQSKEEALINADALFINYSINESKYLKFLNDTGLFMFSKFLLQTPKELTKVVYKNPVGFLKTSVLDSFVDVPDIFESYDYSLWDLISNRQMDVINETLNGINPINKWGRLL